MGLEREARQGGDSMPAATRVCTTTMSSLSVAMRGVKPSRQTRGEQLRLAPMAAADPGGVAMVREAVIGSLANEVDRVVADVE